MFTSSSEDVYKITKRLSTADDEVERYFPVFLTFIDSTEQQIPRPIDNKRRKTYYSDKKKRHIVNTQLLMANNKGIIINKIDHRKGRRHDYDIYKKDHPVIPKQVVTVADLGYLV